jgi:hypothetical protein
MTIVIEFCVLKILISGVQTFHLDVMEPVSLLVLFWGVAWSAIPFVSPGFELVLAIAIAFLDFTFELVVVPLNLHQIIIGKFAPLLLELSLELIPFAFECVRVHISLLLMIYNFLSSIPMYFLTHDMADID